MKKWSVLCLAICMLLTVVACSKPGIDSNAPKDEAKMSEEPAPDTAPPATPAPEAAPVTEPAAAPEAAPVSAPATEAAAPAAPGAATGLEASTWKLGEFTLAFKDAGVLNVKGGPFPEGLDGTYKVENGQITINILTLTKTGTWDGTALIVDGKTAEKQ